MSDMTTKPPRSRVAKIARRTFLVSAGVIGGGLLVGAGAVAARLSGIDAYKLPAGEGETSFGAWLKFNRDGMVEVVVPHQEMGQGIYTLAVLLAAEGLKLPPEAIRPVPAPIHARFANPVMLLDGLPLDDSNAGAVQRATVWTFDKVLRALGLQATGGSTSTRNITDPIRACAASALDLLTQAAADKFNVSASVLKFAGGTIVAPDGRSASYGELTDGAAKLKPRDIALPPIALGTYVGRGIPRVDADAKTQGQAHYGIDTRQPGQLYAAIRHAPRIGGAPERFSLPGKIDGVRGVVEGKDYVAIVADSFAIALAAFDKADLVWARDEGLSISTKDVFAAYRAALDKGEAYAPRWVLDKSGDLKDTSGKVVKATYDAPFLAHATMEPLNATVLLTDTACTVWTGHQSTSLVQLLAANASGLPADAITVMTPYLGGGFGRRADLDYVTKAVEIAKKFKGKPVQTIWTRQEDIRDDVYRPAAMADVSATLDSNGLPKTFTYRIAVPSVTDQFVGRIFASAKGGLMGDRTTVDGAIFPFYGLPNRSIENFTVDLKVPVGFWRSVGYSLNCFFVESFIDELALAAGVKPIEYRTQLIANANGTEPARRAGKLLERLARFDAANPLPASSDGIKRGRGVALTECFHSFVAHLADVEVKGTDIRVTRVYAAVDCGFAIDPPNVAAQVRSAINYGLTAALFGRIDLDNGTVVQSNFDTYPIVTLENAPRIDVDVFNSGAALGGVGEIGTPGTAPAIANAVFAATGQRLRSLPFALAGA